MGTRKVWLVEPVRYTDIPISGRYTLMSSGLDRTGVNMVQAVKRRDIRTYEFLFHNYIIAIALLILLDDIPISSEATHTYAISEYLYMTRLQ